jgi:D-beta-D-heptose 7-phosphate kinase/D-beta-D-heptose 1-phosphate adenosyltransferase
MAEVSLFFMFFTEVGWIRMPGSWIEQWRGSRVFVIGDVMVDKFVYGRVDRVSPEAPIPVLHFQKETTMLGGAGNVARNIVALGGHAILVGVVGQDDGATLAKESAERDNVEARFVIAEDHPTTIKTRYVSGSHQIMRLDVERVLRPDSQTADAIFEHYLDVAPTLSAVVLSDYAKGVLEPALIARIIEHARGKRLPVIVDPKTRDVARYAGATALTPNASEAELIAGCDCHDDSGAEIAARHVRDLAAVDSVVLTRGAQGMTIFNPTEIESGVVHVPTVATDVFDVSGAGDTVVATLALALGSGADVLTAARIANAAAGVAVGKRGTATVQARELSVALGGAKNLGDPKIVDAASAQAIVSDWKEHGLRVGFTNGCFDLLHPGHVELLRQARGACDRLVVALNTDASVKRLKGESRPVQNEHARAIVMAAIKSVDLVTFFDDDTPMRLIELLRPSRLIKGADYTEATVVGADFVKSYGGKIALVNIQAGHSTTSMISRANAGDAK